MRRLTPLFRLLRSLGDPRAWVHHVWLLHFYNYDHVAPRRRMRLDRSVAFSPTVSIRNGERVRIGERTHIGAHCRLWAGPATGRITIGEDTLLGPDVSIFASNYREVPGETLMSQPQAEADVVIGRDAWLGAGVIVVAGVTVGDGTIVGAGSVVTRTLPPNVVAAGIPAKVIRPRKGTSA